MTPSKRLSQTTTLEGKAAEGYTCRVCGGEFLFVYINASRAAGKQRDALPEFCPACGRKLEDTSMKPDF